FAQNLEQGFLLISDLGRQTYYQAVLSGLADDALQQLYRNAIAALVQLQQSDMSGLPRYDQERLLAELQLFPEWYVTRHCGAQLTQAERTMLQKVFSELAVDAA